MFQYKKLWFNITFLDIDWESGFWKSFALFQLAGSISVAPHCEDRSLFYFHTSNYQTRIDLLFVTLYQKWK
jgi:hypothetical protein